MVLCVSDAFHRGVNAIGDANTDLRVPRDEAERKTPSPDTISSASFLFTFLSLSFSLSPSLFLCAFICLLAVKPMTNRWLLPDRVDLHAAGLFNAWHGG